MLHWTETDCEVCEAMCLGEIVQCLIFQTWPYSLFDFICPQAKWEFW